MVWCNNCAKHITRPKNHEGKICCSRCGRVLDEDNFAEEPTFVKNAAGQSQLSGNYVKTIQDDYSASRLRTLNDAYDQIRDIMIALQIDGGESIAQPAVSFYRIAVERNFTRGRRKEQVGAACLYITCRENKKPFLLIDFSEHLRINVYVLGAVFLQLCKLLSLEEHPIVQKPVDPSLFIHRFSDRLFGKKPNVSRTALQIVASMKRDWMQTGRKPSGLCGAALYISALSHGHKCTKSEIIKVVHVCEATLMKRLIEFENTESGGLTIEEFNIKAEEFEREKRLTTSLDSGSKASGTSELLCEHKGSGKSPFAHGLCQDCYTEFIKLSGGLDGGLEPPAFQRAEMQRLMAKEAAAQGSESGDKSTFLNQAANETAHLHRCIKNMSEYRDSQLGGLDSAGATLQHEIHYDSSNDRVHDTEVNSQESETLSDIDDIEVDGYLHNEEEKKLKKIIWEEMNKEYLEEQAAKEAAALAAKKAYEASFSNCSGDVQAAQKLAAAAAAAVAKSRKEKQQKRAAEFKNLGPAQTAAEATRQMLDKKRLSSKINYDVLGKLFDESEPPEITKKNRTEPESNHDQDSYLDNSKEDPEIDDNQDTYGNQDIYDENLEEFDFF